MSEFKKTVLLQYIVVFLIGLLITASISILYYKDEIFNTGKSNTSDKLKNESTDVENNQLNHIRNSKTKSIQAPAEVNILNAEKPITDDTVSDVITETDLSNTEVSKTRVSQFGFGPFPEIPPDYPNKNVFSQVYDHPDFELMDRIRVKLWVQGEKGVLGISEDSGLFYPTIKGVMYVKWSTDEIDGVVKRYASGTTGIREDLDFWDPSKGPLWEDDIPDHIKVIDYDEGINPYTFLDLNIK